MIFFVNLFQNSWRMPKLTSGKQAASDNAIFFLQGGVVTHTCSSKCYESRASSNCWNIFFLVKMWWVPGLMRSEGMTVPNLTVYLLCVIWTYLGNWYITNQTHSVSAFLPFSPMKFPHLIFHILVNITTVFHAKLFSKI